MSWHIGVSFDLCLNFQFNVEQQNKAQVSKQMQILFVLSKFYSCG